MLSTFSRSVPSKVYEVLTGGVRYFIYFIGHRSFIQGNRQSQKITTLTVEEEEDSDL